MTILALVVAILALQSTVSDASTYYILLFNKFILTWAVVNGELTECKV